MTNHPMIERILAEKKATRRDFMTAASALGISATAAGTMWQGRAHAQTPKKGGHYRVGLDDVNTTDTLDPGKFQSQGEIQLAHTMRNWLTEITETNGVGPDLCENWEASPDAKVWTFRLRKGVTFHSGKDFTAEDVKDSLNYHRNEATGSAAAAQVADIEDVTANDKHTVTITMTSGNADLPYTLTDYHLVICPSDGEGNIDWQSGNATGAYKPEQIDMGVRVDLSRNPNYFKEGKGNFDEVTLLQINDPSTRGTALIAGDVDAIPSFELQTRDLFELNPQIEIDEVPSGAHCTIPMFCDTAPFDNLDVRLALKYGIDRQALIDKIIFGTGTIGNDHPIGPTLPYWADLEQREYDPDKSMFHLKKAGLNSLDIDISSSEAAFPGAVDAAVLFKASASKGGINLNVVREPVDGYWSNVWLVKPFVFVQWGARPTPDVMFTLAYKHDAAWNEAHWKNDRFNELLLLAKGELDDAKRTEMYREMQQLCRDDGGTIVPFFRNRVMARRSNVAHGPNITSNWELDGARSAERWWFNDV